MTARRQFSAREQREIRELHAGGLSFRRIVGRFRTSDHRMKAEFRLLGLDPRGNSRRRRRGEAARRLRRRRPCLTCGAAFTSEGSHNRMCESCRQRATPFGLGW